MLYGLNDNWINYKLFMYSWRSQFREKNLKYMKLPNKGLISCKQSIRRSNQEKRSNITLWSACDSNNQTHTLYISYHWFTHLYAIAYMLMTHWHLQRKRNKHFSLSKFSKQHKIKTIPCALHQPGAKNEVERNPFWSYLFGNWRTLISLPW